VNAVREQFAVNLRHLREEANLSQDSLAVICGLHRTWISLLECRKRAPRLETIVILARASSSPPPATYSRASSETATRSH
jgi:transcriptional regulator with XRE-family HTH domain